MQEQDEKRRGTRAEQLRRQLSDDIITGKIFPGVRLDEQVLADRFGVSRTPVREALRQLAATGLVEVRPHKGVVVATITEARMREMFEVMAELEAVCARYAALRMTARERKRLQGLHERCAELVRSGDPNAYDVVNVTFHGSIYRGSHNDFLAETAFSVRNRLAPFRRLQFRMLGRLAKSYTEHDKVVLSILRGDGDGAYAAMWRHVAVVSDASADYLAEVRAGPAAPAPPVAAVGSD